jgi:transposase InsO family protein
MSGKGNCWDNAPTESLWGRLQVGRLYGRSIATRREAMDEVIDWLTFYNHRRLHSTLGYVSPTTFEQRGIAAQQQDRKSAQVAAFGVWNSGARSNCYCVDSCLCK